MKEEISRAFGVEVCLSTIILCRTLRCTRQAMHHVAIQRSDELLKYQYMILPCFYGWMKADVIDAIQSENMAIVCVGNLYVTNACL